jgi:3-oxoadipate CoA-transferase beta subunit
MMEHVAKDNTPKLMAACTYPLTGVGVVDHIYTDLAIIDITPEGFQVRAMLEGLTLEALQTKTGAPIHAAPQMSFIRRDHQGHPCY